MAIFGTEKSDFGRQYSFATWRYRPEIDGLRGIAILAVFLNHVNQQMLPGGYAGVDVFFVISGFLITGILSREASKEAPSIVDFYCRRARRLLPAGTVMAVVVTVMCICFLLPRDLRSFGASLSAYSAFLSNVLFWRWDNYFDGQQATWPLLHTWSLSVEEQFYFIYPWALWSLRKATDKTRLYALSGLAFVSFAVSTWQSHADPRSAYYSAFSRAWEPLVGGLCFYLPQVHLGAHVRNSLGLSGVAGIVAAVLLFTEHTPYPGTAAVLPVFSTALVLWLTERGDGGIKTLLSCGPLMQLGLISYSLYLWHWPILMLARYPWAAAPNTQPFYVACGAGVLSMVIAWASYKYIEKPTRTFQCSNRQVLSIAVSACGILFVLGAVIHGLNGLPWRFSPKAVQYEAGVLDFHSWRDDSFNLPVSMIRAGCLPAIGARDENKQPVFALCGDSHAGCLVPAFDEAASRHGVRGIVFARSATPPLSGIQFAKGGRFRSDDASREAAFSQLDSLKLPYVILAARWSYYLQLDCTRHGKTASSAREKEVMIAAALAETVGRLIHGGARRVWIIEEIPTQPFNVPKQLALQEAFGWPCAEPVRQNEYVEATAPMRRIFEDAICTEAAVVTLGSPFFKDGNGNIASQGKPLYTDHTHISLTAAKQIAPLLNSLFEEMAAHPTTE